MLSFIETKYMKWLKIHISSIKYLLTKHRTLSFIGPWVYWVLETMEKIKATFLHCPHPSTSVCDRCWLAFGIQERTLPWQPLWGTHSLVEETHLVHSKHSAASQVGDTTFCQCSPGVVQFYSSHHCWGVLVVFYFFALFGKIIWGKLALQRAKGRI